MQPLRVRLRLTVEQNIFNMLNKYLTFLYLLIISSFQLVGQAITTNLITPEDAIQNVLLGAGINATNITYNGNAAAAQNTHPNVLEFDATGTTFPIESGIHLSTSGAPLINDADLDAISGGASTNGTIIEFDFIPDGTFISFDYIFASAEYTSFTCSQFNDVFGFFISGPGINGPFTNNAVNIATVPNTNVPVGINTVNQGFASGGGNQPCLDADPNFQNNTQYYTTDYNTIYNASGTIVNFNGSTVVLPAETNVDCNETYHIKLAITNAIDQSFDSGVFLEAGSFASDNVEISLEADNSFLDTLIYRGCSEGLLDFNRFSCDLNDSLIIFIETGGTAVEVTDYDELPDSVIFLPGESNISLNIVPTASGVTQNPESIIITVFFIDEDGDTISSTGTIWITDAPDPVPVTIDTTIYCANDSLPVYGYLTGGFPPYTYEWELSGSTDSTDFVSVLDNGEYYFTITMSDQCNTVVDSARVVVDQTLSIDDMFQFMAECGLPTGAVSGIGSGFTGTPEYTWSGPGPSDSAQSINASVWEDLPSGWYYFSIEDNVCFVNDSIFLEEEPPPTADFDANPTNGNAPLDVTFINNSDPADTYEWDFGNGEGVTVTDLSNQNTTYTEEGVFTVTLTVTDGACSDVATENIDVILLLPLEYDMPNVFTPNGDGSNDVFTINPVNAVSLEMVIFNRWGNVVYESNDVEGTWNGRNNNNGAEVTEGTYFYKFTIEAQDGEIITEHGFVQLVRDN